MSTATVTMSPQEAVEFRAAYGAEVRKYGRWTRGELAAEECRLMREQGCQRLYGGPGNRDELIASVLTLQGFTIERWNLSTHVTAHADVDWPGCEWCAGGAA